MTLARNQTRYSLKDLQNPAVDRDARAVQLGRDELFVVCGDSSDDEAPSDFQPL